MVKLMPYLALLGLYLSLILARFDTYSSLFAAWWNSEELSQGIIILPIAAFLAIKQIGERLARPLRPSYFWGLIFLAANLFLVISKISNIQVGEYFFATMAILAVPLVLYGRDSSRESFFPYLFGAFALPIWDPLNPVFQKISMVVTKIIMGLTTIPHYTEGFSIELAEGVFVIDAGCSGLRYMVSALVIITLYCHLYFKTWKASMLSSFSMIMLALIANWTRIFLIILIGYYSKMQHPIVKDHATFGWVIFACALAFWFYLNRYFHRSENAALGFSS